MEFSLPDTSVTETLGQALARSLPGTVYAGAGQTEERGHRGSEHRGSEQRQAVYRGAVVYLEGELGAGKTTCVRSLLRALGVTGLVRSPTYTLVETYRLAALTCVHVDLYRLQSLTEVDELGLRDLAGPGSLLMVEWPEKGGAALPPSDLDVTLRYSGDARAAEFGANTPLGAEWLDNLGHDSRLVPYVSNLT